MPTASPTRHDRAGRFSQAGHGDLFDAGMPNKRGPHADGAAERA